MCSLGTTTSTLDTTTTMLGTMVTIIPMDTTLPTTTMLCSRKPRKAPDTNDENIAFLTNNISQFVLQQKISTFYDC